jgi:hypothetical protein
MAEWWENIDRTNTRLTPGANPNNYGNQYGISMNQNFVPRNMNMTMPDGVAPFPPKEEIINEDIRLDVGNNLPITPNVPKPGSFYGIPGGVMDLGRRIKGGPYYSQNFPSRQFTEGDRTYNQSGLGGYYHPDEVFNMQEFGGVGLSDPRVDQFGKNIVSMAGDYEEGLEDWVGKYGTMKYNTARMQKKQKDKIAMWNRIQKRRKGIEDANRAASNQHLARQKITHSGPGGGGAFIDPGGRDRGGEGAFRENIEQMRGAARSYTDALGNVGYSSGRAQGGRIGLRTGGDPEEIQDDISTFEFMQDQGIPFGEMAEGEEDPLSMLIAQYIEQGFSPAQAERMAIEELQARTSGQDEGLASLI